MLLGIGLHASLSFMPTPWPVQDTQRLGAFGLFTAFVHGFRMPLFFLVSGFFTMMLFRQRGLMSLLAHRATRLLLPCLLGLITIVPLTRFVFERAGPLRCGSGRRADASTLSGASAARDGAAMTRLMQEPDQMNRRDEQFGITPLNWAVMIADAALVEQLIARRPT